MSDRYQVKPVKQGSDRYEIWDTQKAKPLSAEGNDMRAEQANDLAAWLNARESEKANTAKDSHGTPELDAVQQEIARRVATASTASEAHDVGEPALVVISRPGTRATAPAPGKKPK